jgi:hypothetical protein
LSEEELELSYIDYAGLRVELQDGSRHLLKANRDELANSDARYLRIKPGQAAEFEFSLPPELEAHAIARSTLIVKGYYEPYSRMELSER